MTVIFEQTSNEPYDRHDYKLVFSNKNCKIFDNFEDLRKAWWETPHQLLGYVEVLDKKKPKKSKDKKGF
jgi:hypothetical protein